MKTVKEPDELSFGEIKLKAYSKTESASSVPTLGTIMNEDAGEQVGATVPASGTSQKLPADLGLKGANQQQLAVHGGTAGCCCSPSGEGHLLGCLQVTLPVSQEVGHRDCQRLDDKGSGASRIVSSELPFSSSNIWYHGNVIWDQRSTLTWLLQTRNVTSDRGEISRVLSGKGKGRPSRVPFA